MSREALYPMPGSNCIFRETFNSPLVVARNGGVATDVSFLNGIGTFNGSTSKIDYGRVVRGGKSIRIIATLNSTTEDILNLSASHSIEATTGTLTATGFSSPTIYVDNVATDTITAGKHEIIVVTATAIEANDIIIGFVSAYFQDTIELIEFFNETLTVEEVSLLYQKKLYAGLITDGLVGYWDFMRGTAHDWSGNDNDGTVYGAVFKYNEGLRFDGVDDYVDIGSVINAATDNFSICAWIKTSDDTGRIVSRRDAVGTHFDFYIQAQKLGLYDGSDAFSGSGIPNDDIWHHVVVVINGASSRFYLDGSTDGSSFTPTITTYAIDAFIGRAEPAGAGYAFLGQISDVRIFNRVLTLEEITQEYHYNKRRLNP